MNKHFFSLFPVLLLLLAVSLITACGKGGELPPLRPQGMIGGKVTDGGMKDANVRVFSLSGIQKKEKLGETVVKEDGTYLLPVRAKSQLVLVEVSSGSYAEKSSGKVVALGEGEVLRSVAFYESGEELTVMVTPVTHIMTGYTFYKMLSGVDPVLAANEATGEMSDIFTFPVDKTSVTDISDERVQNTELSNELTYGFFLAALSSWTQWVSEQNEPEPHLNYNSVGATQIFYDDVFADGFLDGRGLKKDNGETLDLYYGTVKIDQDVYRTAFAQHMLATANSAVNKTSINASELLDFAHTFATNRASIFGTQLPGQLEETPVVYALEKEDAFQRGQFHFTAAIGGITGAKSVEFFIDSETEPLGVASDPLKPYVDIDTASYTDGSHQIRVVATNVFDRTSEENFSYRFDNTSPMISISSPLLTNQTIYQISGTYNDAGSGTKAIEVQGTNASLATNGEWTAPVTLQAGENVLSFTLVDHSGNESTQTFSINLDQTAPNINTDNGHGSALFDNGSGLVSRQITSENIIEALVIDAKNIKLNGVGINRESLDSNGIPYFAFQTEDLPVSGIASSFDDISVFLKYTKNGQILSDWKKIVAVDNEYLLPLVTETLVPEWAESAPNDEQLLFLKSIDKAGNESITQFSFKVDFRVSDVAPDKLLVEGTDYFSAYDGIGFVNRLALNEQEIPVVRYQYTNDANHAKYIKIEDTGNHLLQRSYDEAVRLNKVKFKISTEWRFKPIINLLDRLNCPTGVGDWLSIEKIYNHTNVIDAETGVRKSIWEPRFLPDPVFSGEIDVYSDIPPDPPESRWLPYHFDDNFLVRYAENGDQTEAITYLYDYAIDVSLFTIQPAMVKLWNRNVIGSSEVLQSCDDIENFQQNLIYESVPVQDEFGVFYPKNQLTESLESEASFFQTHRFTVSDIEEGDVQPVDGWFRIPPGNSVWITKIIKMPVFNFFNDTDVTNIVNFTSYEPRKLDKELTWTIDQSITIQSVHDAGLENINYMTPQIVEILEPEKVYKIVR